jgi:alpha-ribazole phosphatase/probable phosphoglycerate mutase
MPVRLAYETHSWSTDNEAGLATGWLPGRLSPRGRTLAPQIRDRHPDVDVVLTSDLARAAETAYLAYAGAGVPVLEDVRLREVDLGELNGAPVGPVNDRRPRCVDISFPGGQSYRDVVAQTRDLLGDLAAHWGGDHVLLVAHSANKLALDHLLLGRDLTEAVAAAFDWREGWEYLLPDGWT